MNFQIVISFPQKPNEVQRQFKQTIARDQASRNSGNQQKPLENKQKNFKPPKRMRRKFWKEDEKLRYLEFLQKHCYEFTKTLQEKIMNRINVQMSNYIKTKNPKQCRSHHQKMIQKWGNVEQILIKERLSQKDSQFNQKEKEMSLSEVEQQNIQHLQCIYPEYQAQKVATCLNYLKKDDFAS